MGSGSNLRDNPTNPVVPDLDDIKARVELPKQLEDRCKWLEEKFRVMKNVDYLFGVNAKELSLVPDLVLPPKLKTPEFKKYNGTSFPKAHITIFCRRMTRYVNNDQLLIHCFQDSLIRSAAKWYSQVSRANINSWKDLA
ncbi:intersectin-1-like [Gossypium australe]|uniref:Intersectin-1-like n=1 Tax=Gossypium australe TaxID=47621 RepID=A0A5B6VV58_9ROSI|nr:intersectin-1-like [Gossypium australe]